MTNNMFDFAVDKLLPEIYKWNSRDPEASICTNYLDSIFKSINPKTIEQLAVILALCNSHMVEMGVSDLIINLIQGGEEKKGRFANLGFLHKTKGEILFRDDVENIIGFYSGFSECACIRFVKLLRGKMPKLEQWKDSWDYVSQKMNAPSLKEMIEITSRTTGYYGYYYDSARQIVGMLDISPPNNTNRA